MLPAMDVHNICLVVTLLSIFVSSVVIWLSFRQPHYDSISIRHERDINSVLRDLQTSQKLASNITDREATLQFLSSYKQWRYLERNLGNYFTGGYFVHREKYHREYSHSPLTILPFFHDIHGDFEKCLLRTTLAHNQAVSPKMTLWNRLKWDTSSEGVFKFKHKFKVHYGQASFGACSMEDPESSNLITTDGSYSVLKDGLGIKHQPGLSESEEAASYISRCGHVFIMQDPISLAISDLGECLLDPRSSPLCQLVHQNSTTVEEWIAARGSTVFRHILFTSDICQNKTRYPNWQQEALSEQNSSNAVHLSPQELCESNHGKFVDSLTPDVIERLVSFITGNIQNLFSVVGIFEDLGNSLTLLNHVFRLPLHECEFLSKFSDTSAVRKSKFSHRLKHSSPKGSSANAIKTDLSENSQDKIVPLLPKLVLERQDEAALLEALTHIESSLVWDKEIRTTTTSVPNVSENYQTSDSMFDYDMVGSSIKEIVDEQFSDLRYSGGDSNESSLENDPWIYPVNDSRTNPADSRQHFENSFSDHQSLSFDITEDDDEEGDDDSPEEVVSENMISSRSTKLKTDAVLLRLCNKFLSSERIKQTLAPDLRIYDAVKKLYFAQKQLFFNSM